MTNADILARIALRKARTNPLAAAQWLEAANRLAAWVPVALAADAAIAASKGVR